MRRLRGKEIVIGFGHPVYTTGDPRNKVIKEVARRLSKAGGDTKLFDIAGGIEPVMWREKKESRHPKRDSSGPPPSTGAGAPVATTYFRLPPSPPCVAAPT